MQKYRGTKYKKLTRVIIINAVSIFAFVILFTLPAHAPHARPNSDDKTPQITNQTTSLPTTTTKNPTDTPNLEVNSNSPENQIIIRFESDKAKADFIEANRLSEDQLEFIPALRSYLVDRRLATSLTLGTTTFANHRYQALLTPVDPIFGQQWYLPRVNTSTSWNHQIGSEFVKTAVIDTGFALNHQDLVNRWAINNGESGTTAQEGPEPNCTSRNLELDKRCNNYDDDSDGFRDNYLGWDFVSDSSDVSAGRDYPELSDTASHGTMVSGIIGASANNNIGITGINWQSRILPIQALDDSGTGYTVSVALAIRYAVDHGADVINMSLGTSYNDPLVSEQIDYAESHGTVVVAAAGNDGCDCILYPARYSSVIAVGATTSTNQRAYFSSYGQNLDLVAPGYDICSLAWTAENPTSQTACGLAGTSFASPIVAGAVSLLLSQNPTLSPNDITSTLRGTATKLTGMNNYNFSPQYGYGLLNIYNSIADVSITTPVGSPLSTDRVTLSELASELSNYNLDKYNSACKTTLENTTCAIRAINTLTNQVIIIAENLEPNETRDLQPTIAGSGLEPGVWLLQNYLIGSSGIYSMSREKTVTIID
jgi:subtilisin family serine protease